MAKLHQLLAVETDLKGTYVKILAETAQTFSKREDHFKGFIRVCNMFDQAAPQPPDERKALDTTVNAKLEYQNDHVVRYLDAVLQKEATNQQATADIVIDDKIIAENVPATFLLGLEKNLANLRMVYNQIPTLPPGIDWEPDPATGEGVYKRQFPEEKFKTEQTIVPQILYEATQHHPAQVDKISETKNIGKYVKNEWCGMLSLSEKVKLLAKIDTLTRAVKKARQKANNTPVVKTKIGQSLIDFIHG